MQIRLSIHFMFCDPYNLNKFQSCKLLQVKYIMILRAHGTTGFYSLEIVKKGYLCEESMAKDSLGKA